MKLNRLFFLCAAVFLIGWSGCCELCKPEFLGTYYLSPGSETWFQAVGSQTRIFKSSQGRETTFDYGPKNSGEFEQSENCDEVGNCGVCCEYSYGYSFIATEFVSANRDMSFELAIIKDFRQNSPLQSPSTIDDYLSITLNQRLVAELPGLPDTVLSQNATINGRTFTQVFAYEITGQDPSSKNPVALYFNKLQGVVGFKLADGEEWSLEQ